MLYNSTIKKINALRNGLLACSNEELLRRSLLLKEKIKTTSDNKLLPEAFALVKEASRRTIGKEHYDVQLAAGVALYTGNIAEAKTGEGKTITIYLPAFLAALYGNGVHVVTVNDYLANRDATEAAKVFSVLGITVGCVLNNSTKEERKAAYSCDITYVTNSELGFDYLKDNLANTEDDIVLRDLNYAIIDEVDSILIDEAKTPLIISGQGPDTDSVLFAADSFVKTLDEGVYKESSTIEKMTGKKSLETGDFVKVEKENSIYLTENGIKKLESSFRVHDYGSINVLLLQRAINNALRANYLMNKDRDYVVRNDKVEIVDTFTGRVLPGRRFSDGLHQALEIKESVSVQTENLTIATITFQSFFNKYKKKAGLTGTAKTSEKEFKEIYNLNVIQIPTNKPVIRKDLNDVVFRTKKEKWRAVINAVKEANEKGQPVLVGTASIEDSETVSKLLDAANIKHNTLNAKNEEYEAEIIATAGAFGSVTVATNMAGRGTDIMLDEEAKKAGGLKVIGTERHDSRRIDNQLKGRSGRQGDPGESQFYISLEDRVMRVFGDSSSLDVLMAIGSPDGQPIQNKSLNKLINKAQDAVETENRLIRENMIKYDVANNEYREQIYKQRMEILKSNAPLEFIRSMFNQISDSIIDAKIKDGQDNSSWDVEGVLKNYFEQIAHINIDIDTTGMKKEDFKNAFRQTNDLLLDIKKNEFNNDYLAAFVEKRTLLKFIDRSWVLFLSSMEYVKQNIRTQSYAQKDPVAEYKKKGAELFNQMIDNIKSDVVLNFMRCQVRYQENEETELK